MCASVAEKSTFRKPLSLMTRLSSFVLHHTAFFQWDCQDAVFLSGSSPDHHFPPAGPPQSLPNPSLSDPIICNPSRSSTLVNYSFNPEGERL